MMPSFFVDACMPKSSAKLLKGLGHDALDAREISLGGAKDPKIYEYAQKENRILVTRDKGFGDIRSYPPGSHAGIVVLRLPSSFTASQISKVLKDFIEDVETEQLKKGLAIVEVGRYRIRRP